MQPGAADGTFHRIGISVAVGLCDSLLTQFLHTGFGVFVLGILQLYNVAVRHVGVDVQHRTEENIDIARLRVLFGDGAVETVLCGHGKGEAMHEELALLLVALRGVGLQAVSDVVEVGFPVAIVSELTCQFTLFVTAETEVSFVVGA